MATGSLIYFPKQRSTPRKPKPTDKKKPTLKANVLEWIRHESHKPDEGDAQ